jgi:hypothetical protein
MRIALRHTPGLPSADAAPGGNGEADTDAVQFATTFCHMELAEVPEMLIVTRSQSSFLNTPSEKHHGYI